jgi:hypothetical protein
MKKTSDIIYTISIQYLLNGNSVCCVLSNTSTRVLSFLSQPHNKTKEMTFGLTRHVHNKTFTIMEVLLINDYYMSTIVTYLNSTYIPFKLHQFISSPNVMSHSLASFTACVPATMFLLSSNDQYYCT